MIINILLWIITTLVASTLIILLGFRYGIGLVIGSFAGLIVISQILAVKIVVFGPFLVPAAVIVYAVSFLLTDALCEFYDKDTAKQAVWAGFLSSILLIIAIQIAIAWSNPPFWVLQSEFIAILGPTWRIVVASLVAYLFSQNWDVFLFHAIRDITGEEHLWLRNISSTVTSQGIDTVIFITIAFWGTAPLIPLIIGQYIVKLIIAGMDTPFLYFLHYIKDNYNI